MSAVKTTLWAYLTRTRRHYTVARSRVKVGLTCRWWYNMNRCRRESNHWRTVARIWLQAPPKLIDDARRISPLRCSHKTAFSARGHRDGALVWRGHARHPAQRNQQLCLSWNRIAIFIFADERALFLSPALAWSPNLDEYDAVRRARAGVYTGDSGADRTDRHMIAPAAAAAGGGVGEAERLHSQMPAQYFCFTERRRRRRQCNLFSDDLLFSVYCCIALSSHNCCSVGLYIYIYIYIYYSTETVKNVMWPSFVNNVMFKIL